MLSGNDTASKSAPKSEFSDGSTVTSCQSISPPGSNSAVSKASALIMQDVSAEESSISQSSADSLPDNSNSNRSSEKPSLGRNRLKSLANIVHNTLVVKRKVQLVNLNSVISSQRYWRTNSEGYQNLFEFGEFAFRQSALKPIFNIVLSQTISGCFMLLFLVVLSLEMNIAESFTVNNVGALFLPMSCLK